MAYWPRDDDRVSENTHIRTRDDEGMDSGDDEEDDDDHDGDDPHGPRGTYRFTLSPTELATDDEADAADVHSDASDEPSSDSEDESESDSWSRSSSNVSGGDLATLTHQHRSAPGPSTSGAKPKHKPRARRATDDKDDSGSDGGVDSDDDHPTARTPTSTHRKRKRASASLPPSSDAESEGEARHKDNFHNWPKEREREEVHAELSGAAADLEWWDYLADNPGDLNPRAIKYLVLPHPLLRRMLDSDWPADPINKAYRKQLGHIRQAAIALFKKIQYSTFRGKVIYLRRALRLVTTPPILREPPCSPCARKKQSCVEGVEGCCQYCNLLSQPVV